MDGILVFVKIKKELRSGSITLENNQYVSYYCDSKDSLKRKGVDRFDRMMFEGYKESSVQTPERKHNKAATLFANTLDMHHEHCINGVAAFLIRNLSKENDERYRSVVKQVFNLTY